MTSAPPPPANPPTDPFPPPGWEDFCDCELPVKADGEAGDDEPAEAQVYEVDDQEDEGDDQDEGDAPGGDEPDDDPYDLDELPLLDEATVDDLDALAVVVDALVLGDRAARRLQTQVDELHAQLHERLAPFDFALVLRAEEVVNARTTDLLLSVAVWAFNEGRRGTS